MSVKVYYIILFGHDVHQYFLCDLKTTEIASCFLNCCLCLKYKVITQQLVSNCGYCLKTGSLSLKTDTIV